MESECIYRQQQPSKRTLRNVWIKCLEQFSCCLVVSRSCELIGHGRLMVTRGLRVWDLGTLGGGDARLVVGSLARLSGPWNLEIQDNFTDETTIGIPKN
jgi:hypothetical protein